MSLVDYASSDEDESEVREEEEVEERGSLQAPKRKSESPKHHPLPPQRQTSRLSSNEHLGSSHSSEPSVVKLPDASVLLNSTHVSSHLVSVVVTILSKLLLQWLSMNHAKENQMD
ncbi:hypothetical protein Acr_15g0012480 [Actinidia rufa]|uniref:Uncharacterized protein n=1 Tax=Actinidia rufa TaxID=165716 RepID=A0A7J0FWV9_9ERIC|nr:hypothetical protein Acr_15g0012480 [Actinidia rufa]